MSIKECFDFSGKTIIVTGGSSGIGRQTAISLSELGARIVLIARREEQLQETMELLENEGHCYYVMDLTEIEAIEDLIKRIVAEQGKIFGLAYCAGIAKTMPLKMSNYQYVDAMMKTNFYAFYEMVRHLTKKGRYEDGARIVSISSAASTGFAKGQSVYGATKAAMEASIRVLGQELMTKNIHINAIRPAWVKTDMVTEFNDRVGDGADIIREQQPMGLTEPSEVADMVIYLMSTAARGITGQSILLGGGTTSL